MSNKFSIAGLKNKGWHVVAIPSVITGNARFRSIRTTSVERLQFKEILKWCNESFDKNAFKGSICSTKSYTVAMGTIRFAFKNEHDATLFSLKWK